MNMHRRDALRTMALGSLAVAAGRWNAQAQTAPTAVPPAAGPYTLPPLPYAFEALEPHVDAQTMQIHHDKHHATYVQKLNEAIAKHPELGQKPVDDLIRDLAQVPQDIRIAVRNHGGGHANHSLFWNCLSASGGGEAQGALAEAVQQAFGSFKELREQLGAAAKGVFGSGWAWLCLGGDRRLVVLTTPNQDSPLTDGHIPLLGIDVWEHAYYLKHQNRRADYVEALFNVIDWGFVGQRFESMKSG